MSLAFFLFGSLLGEDRFTLLYKNSDFSYSSCYLLEILSAPLIGLLSTLLVMLYGTSFSFKILYDSKLDYLIGLEGSGGDQMSMDDFNGHQR